MCTTGQASAHYNAATWTVVPPRCSNVGAGRPEGLVSNVGQTTHDAPLLSHSHGCTLGCSPPPPLPCSNVGVGRLEGGGEQRRADPALQHPSAFGPSSPPARQPNRCGHRPRFSFLPPAPPLPPWPQIVGRLELPSIS
ncbi:hypothetical protein B0H14DRAFT_3483064 [Mycena olivaceomarginata]|nr:hypothetical protein B0H14DRAFT_3483064 [Mycena olivaceomarginata]